MPYFKGNIYTYYVTELAKAALSALVVQCYRVVYYGIYRGISQESRVLRGLAECVYQKHTNDIWDIPWYTTRSCCITILLKPGSSYSVIREFIGLAIMGYEPLIIPCSTNMVSEHVFFFFWGGGGGAGLLFF